MPKQNKLPAYNKDPSFTQLSYQSVKETPWNFNVQTRFFKGTETDYVCLMVLIMAGIVIFMMLK
jgi:hypothetical protein